jgi:hypothetical protein
MDNDNRFFWVCVGATAVLLLVLALMDIFTPKPKGCGCGDNPYKHQPDFDFSESDIDQLKAMIEAKDKPLSKAEKKELLLDLQIAHYRKQDEFFKKRF